MTYPCGPRRRYNSTKWAALSDAKRKEHPHHRGVYRMSLLDDIFSRFRNSDDCAAVAVGRTITPMTPRGSTWSVVDGLPVPVPVPQPGRAVLLREIFHAAATIISAGGRLSRPESVEV